jgi:hypothetical protein
MTTTWRARDSRGHYLASKDVHTTLGPEDWDDTCRHEWPEPQRCSQCGRNGTHGFTTLANEEHQISITVCANKNACRKRWPKPARDAV